MNQFNHEVRGFCCHTKETTAGIGRLFTIHRTSSSSNTTYSIKYAFSCRVGGIKEQITVFLETQRGRTSTCGKVSSLHPHATDGGVFCSCARSRQILSITVHPGSRCNGALGRIRVRHWVLVLKRGSLTHLVPQTSHTAGQTSSLSACRAGWWKSLKCFHPRFLLFFY